MSQAGGGRSPLFLRIFLLMLACVAAAQVLNLVALMAAQAPRAEFFTAEQVADALRDPTPAAPRIDRIIVDSIEPVPWNPRSERMAMAIATLLDVPRDRVRVRFEPPPFQRQPRFDRGPPIPEVPISKDVARGFVLTDDFWAAWQRPDGRWVRVRPTAELGPWRWFVLFWLGATLVAVTPFAWLLAQRVARPFGLFAAAAERLGRDPRAAPMMIEGPEEIAEAAAAFNRMQAQLNRYIDDRTTVIGALAHDLRTPLMRLALRLEDAPDSIRTACESDIRDMNAMIAATIGYVREAGVTAHRRRLDLRSLAETLIDEMADAGLPVTLLPGAPLVIDGYAAGLKTMLANLVSNAVKYGGGAEVLLETRDGSAIIEVRDRGPGMCDDDLAHAFDPFFRGERSRNRDTGGLGLGLASVQAMARAHGGEVVLANQPNGGLLARVSLPTGRAGEPVTAIAAGE